MLVKYLTLDNLLKFKIWWELKEYGRKKKNSNIFFIWKNVYIQTLIPFTFLFLKMVNVFLNYLQFEQKKIFIYTTLFFDRHIHKKKEFLVYYSTFFITNIWLRGFITNFWFLRWKIFMDFHFYLRSHYPQMLINLTDQINPSKEAKTIYIPSICMTELATYPLTGSVNIVNSYFYFTFFLTLLSLDLFKPVIFGSSSFKKKAKKDFYKQFHEVLINKKEKKNRRKVF